MMKLGRRELLQPFGCDLPSGNRVSCPTDSFGYQYFTKSIAASQASLLDLSGGCVVNSEFPLSSFLAHLVSHSVGNLEERKIWRNLNGDSGISRGVSEMADDASLVGIEGSRGLPFC